MTKRSAAVAWLLVASLTSPAWAQDTARDVLPGSSASVEKGRAHFQRGVELFREGDYRAALVEFKRSYESAPSYRILYNIGQTSFELQDYANALRAFERYLAEGGADVPANRRTIVEGEIRKLQGRVARVDVEVNVAGAQITVDDAPVGTSPLSEPVLVSAGVRRIAALKPPLVAALRSVELAGGDRTKIVLKLEDPPQTNPDRPEPSGPTALNPITGAPQDPCPNRTPSWISLGVTGALGAGAAVTGLLALQANSKLQDDLDQTYPGDQNIIDDSRSNLRTWSYVADGLTVATIIAAGVTVYLGFRTAGRPARTDARAPGGLQFVGARPGGLAFTF
jgi:tetratricopeptide (TPR) repeat protein